MNNIIHVIACYDTSFGISQLIVVTLCLTTNYSPL